MTPTDEMRGLIERKDRPMTDKADDVTQAPTMPSEAKEAIKVTQAFEKRLAIYRFKRAAADPFAEEIYNRHEELRYVIDAIELLALEAGVVIQENSDGE